MTDYGPERYERELERRRRAKLRKRAQRRRRKLQQDTNDEIVLDDNSILDEFERDRYQEAERLLSQDDPDEDPEPKLLK